MKTIVAVLLALICVPAFAEPAPAPMKLFLLIGQSNMAGRGKVEPQDQVENPKILMLTKELKWVPAKDPLHFDKPSAGVGLGSQFAREVWLADTNATIGLIPCAVGGTSLDQWKPGGALYKTAVTRATAAMKQGQIAGILWHQGESDSGNPKLVATYPERFAAMIQQLRQDLKAESVPVVLGELIPGRGNHDAINAVLPQAVKQTPHSALASAAGLGNKALHFNSADLRTLGKRYAAEYLKLTKP